MKKLAYLAAGVLCLTACGQAEKTAYSVTTTFDESVDGKTAYLINFDNDEKIDSAVFANGVAQFNGDVATPVMVRLIVDGGRGPLFILEADSIKIDKTGVKGGAFNTKMDEINKAQYDLTAAFRSLPDSIRDARYEEFADSAKSMNLRAMNANINNPIGYFLFIQNAPDMSLDEINEYITNTPSLGESQRIAKLKTTLENRDATSVGKKFRDFEVQYNDSTYRLSDYVGNGDYVLVDFWASWCGPCIRQTAVIKDLLKEYGPKGLKVLGVAVWDKPEDTLEGIKSHELPWTNIINAQSIPTELYGINGIPCIILFGPDGTILSRDKQNDELRADVAAAFAE
ncbi:MAG: AhpC/TSA family protein [Muribaculaceae bacterium]|nr:AhpC/TSA family protein [Muribaculaceae bacterium]